MAFSLKGSGGTVNSAAANQSSVVLTTATTAGASGDLAVIRYALDNAQTTDGDEGAVTGIVDSAGNLWVKAVEFTNGQGGTQAGAVCGIWYSNVTAPLPTGSTITLSLTNNTLRDASAVGLEYFTKAAGTVAAIEGTPGTLAADGAAAGSLDVTTSNIACLRIRAIASESSTATALTKTAAFTAVLGQDLTTGGSSTSNQGIRGEYLISTATGQASNPTAGAGSVDHASVYVAFREDTVVQPPSGWQRGNDIIKAIPPIWPMVLLCTQATTFAVPPPPDNNVTAKAWHQPLSVAVPVAKAQQGHASVPFNTPQVATSVPTGWQSIASAAPSRAVVNGSALTFAVAPFAVPSGWQSALSIAAPAVKARQGGFFVPLNTPQIAVNTPVGGWLGQAPKAAKQAAASPTQATSFQSPAPPDNNTTAKAWHQPLSVAAPVAQAKPGSTFVPFNTVQVAAVPQGWQPIVSVAPVRASVQGSALTFVVAPVDVPRGWERPLSVAPLLAKVSGSSLASPLYTAPVVDNNTTAKAWQQPLSGAPKTAQAAPTQATNYSIPAPASNSATQFGWYQPLAKAAPVAKAKQGEFFVPFDTEPSSVVPVPLVQASAIPWPVTVYYQAWARPPAFITVDNNTTSKAWHQPLSVAAPVAQARQGFAFVPFNTVQTVPGLVTYDKYQQPLSTAVPVAKVVQTYSFVPFDTVQTVTATPQGWQSVLSVAVPVARAAYTQASFVALPFPQYPLGWLQALSTAVNTSKAVATQPTFTTPPIEVPRGWYQALSQAPLVAKVRFDNQAPPLFWADNTVTVEKWQQPLSVAVAVAKAQQGSSFVPLDTAQTPPTGIAGMAWFMPLGTVAHGIPTAPQGFAFVPFDTVQVPPADIAGEEAHGGTLGRSFSYERHEIDKAFEAWKRKHKKNKKLEGAVKKAIKVLEEVASKGLLADLAPAVELKEIIETLPAKPLAAVISEIREQTRLLEQMMDEDEEEIMLMVLALD